MPTGDIEVVANSVTMLGKCTGALPFEIKNSESVAEELGVPLLGKMPIDVSLAQMVDNGEFERFENEYLKAAADYIEEKTKD